MVWRFGVRSRLAGWLKGNSTRFARRWRRVGQLADRDFVECFGGGRGLQCLLRFFRFVPWQCFHDRRRLGLTAARSLRGGRVGDGRHRGGVLLVLEALSLERACFGFLAPCFMLLKGGFAAAFDRSAPVVAHAVEYREQRAEPGAEFGQCESRDQVDRDDERGGEHDGRSGGIEGVLQRIGDQEPGGAAEQDGVVEQAPWRAEARPRRMRTPPRPRCPAF